MKCKYLDHQICIRTTGEFRLCCISREESQQYNIQTHTIEQWLNSDTHRTALKLMSEDVFPSACEKCEMEEKLGVVSMRQKTRVYGPGISHLDIRFGNNCNLQCVMCHPFSSSSLLQEHKKLGDQSPWGTIQVESLDWYEDNLADQLASIPTLKEVYLTGGEPMMVKGLDKFLKKLDSSVAIRFNTNGTIYNKRILDELSRFGYVNMCFSVDGIGKVNDYIRYGSNFDEIEQNLKIAIDKGFEVSLGPTVQIFNCLYMQELYDFAKNYNIKVYENFLITPDHYALQHAVIDLKKDLIMFKEYTNELANKQEKENLIRITKVFDNSRNIKIKDYLPELCRYYDFD